MSSSWEIKHRLGEAINAHDLKRVLECYHPDAVLVTPAGVAEGHDQIAWIYEQFFKSFPDWRQTPWFEVDCDDPAVSEGTITGTHTGPFLLPDGRELEGTGRRITVRASCVGYVENDKILTHREYWDQLELYSQLGFGLAELDLPGEQTSAHVRQSASRRGSSPGDETDSPA
jgi:ketosteroid isomerase-like protein